VRRALLEVKNENENQFTFFLSHERSMDTDIETQYIREIASLLGLPAASWSDDKDILKVRSFSYRLR
jgi:hypothetical protein